MRVDVGSDPYKRCTDSHRCACVCRCIPLGGQGRPPLQGVLRFRRTLCNFAIAHRRVDVGIDPYGQIALSPFAVRFCGCTLHGRGRTPPLRNRGEFCGFALVRPNLQRRTAQSFRHGCAVPPPFTQGRLWCIPFRIGAPKFAPPYRAGGASPAPTLRRNTAAVQAAEDFSSGQGARATAYRVYAERAATPPWRKRPADYSSNLSTAMNASDGTDTVPNVRMRFLPSFCFSSSFFLRVMSPP